MSERPQVEGDIWSMSEELGARDVLGKCACREAVCGVLTLRMSPGSAGADGEPTPRSPLGHDGRDWAVHCVLFMHMKAF